jgi:hypothetical protein
LGVWKTTGQSKKTQTTCSISSLFGKVAWMICSAVLPNCGDPELRLTDLLNRKTDEANHNSLSKSA